MNNEIKALKEQVFLLETQVRDLERKIDNQTHMIDVSYWDYGIGNTYRYKFPIKTAIKLILRHLGLKIEVIEPQDEVITLIKENTE